MDELNPDLPEGLLFRQGPHQFDSLRVLGGGLVKSVRGVAGVWDEPRRMVGAYAAYLSFEDGVVATAVSSGYDHFFTADLGTRVPGSASVAPISRRYGQARMALVGQSAEAEKAMLRPRARLRPAPWLRRAVAAPGPGRYSGLSSLPATEATSYSHGRHRRLRRGRD